MNPNPQAPPATVQWILWAAILMSVLVYALMPFFLPIDASPSEGSDVVFVGSFALLAAMCAAASFAVRHLMWIAPLERGELDLSSTSGRARFFQVSLVCWVLSESVGICGLVLFFLGSSQAVLYGFVLGAVVLLGIHAPRRPGRGSSTLDRARPDVKIG